MFKNTLIGIFLVGTAVFAYLYETEKKKVEKLTTTTIKQDRAIAFVDSINTVVINANTELADANEQYAVDMAEINWAKEQIEEALNDLVNDLNNVSVDSLADYLICNFKGNHYKLVVIDEETYTALQTVTTRDIVEQDLAYKAQKKLFKQLSREMDAKDTLIKKQAKTILITTTANVDLIAKNLEVLADRAKIELKVVSLEGSLDRQKKITIGSVTLNGALILAIIFL